MTDQPPTDPLAAALSKPLGWDQVFEWDTCDCPKDGLHQPSCVYHGWDPGIHDYDMHEDAMRAERDRDIPADDDPDED